MKGTLRHTTIPARVLEGISDDEAARVTLVSNSLRGSNYITEFWAVKHLERSGVGRDSISNDSGMSASMLTTRDILSGLERRIFVGAVEGKIRPTFMMAIARLPREVQRRLGDTYEANGRLLKRDIDIARREYQEATRPSVVPPPPDSPIGVSRSMPEEPPGWFKEIPEPRPEIMDAAIDPVHVEPPTPSRSPSISLPAGGISSGPERENVSLTVPIHDVEPARSEPESMPVDGTVPGIARFRSPDDRSNGAVDDGAHRERSRQVEPELPAVDPDSTEDHVEEVPADLRMALRTVTQQAANRGASEDMWIAEARSAYRRSLKQVSMAEFQVSRQGRD